MANGLLDYLSGFGSTPPEYLGGLLGQDAVDKLKGRAATTGIANAVLGYLAAPKNQNLGLGRIIGQSLQAGMTGAQGVYDNATQDYMMQQKVADLQRKQARDIKVQDMISGIADPRERLAAEIAPEQYVAASLKPQKAFNILTPEQTTAYGLPTDKGQRYQMTETGVSLIGGTETKDRTTKEIDAGNKILIVDAVTGQTIREVPKAIAPTKATEPSYSIQTDANGRAIYVPNKPGMPAIDAATGAPTVYQPAPTPAQEKAKEKATKAATIPTLLNEAKKLIPQATGSKLGNIADEAAATFGESTLGAQKIASLKAIEAQLILNMPRLEGPQGVLDLILYKEAAAQVGNPKIPANTKLAALQTLEDINKRTANPSGAILPKNAPMPKRSKQDILNQYGVNQ
jgi:hypothetical protein